jgi:hypothetical protein
VKSKKSSTPYFVPLKDCLPKPPAIDSSRTKHFHILNLGAGVQSTTMYLLEKEGKILDARGQPIKFDCAIFADTQEEPQDDGDSVYTHLEWLKQQGGCPIIVSSCGSLGNMLMVGKNSTGGRFASIPAYTLKPCGSIGAGRRQCTKEMKIEEIQRVIRRTILKLKPRQRIPITVLVHQYIGISLDEVGRMLRMRKRQALKPVKWQHFHFPLIEQFGWTREECRAYLKDRVPHRVPRSACTFCPYHSNEEWQRIKSRNGKDWERVVQIDRALRIPGNVVNRKLNAKLYLHNTCKPIDEIDFETAPSEREMAGECEGMCGH